MQITSVLCEIGCLPPRINEMAEVSLSIHPADRYSYTTRLTRQETETS
jgi:hypothetical protein